MTAGFGVDRGSGSSTGNPDSVIPEALIDAKGDLIVGTADNTAARLAVGADGTRLVADSAQVPGVKWVADTTNYAIAAKGDILAGTAAQTLVAVTVGTNGKRLAADSAQSAGVAWVADTQNTVADAKGDLLVGTAADTIARLAVGTNGQVPVADSAQSTGILWSDVPTNTSPHRQTQLSGPLDSSGYNNTLSAGAGLNFNVDASPTSVTYSFAGGFNSAGASDLVTVLSADASNQGSLNASNTHYIHATRSSVSAVTWGQCLIPPQYGYTFDRAQGALLNFEAADASTTMADDFGNTWTATANAQIDTAQSKFGTASLLLDGTGDYISTTNITSLGDGSWEISNWVRFNAFPVGGNALFWACRNAGGFGISVGMNEAAGTKKLIIFASSNSSSFDIANGTLGTSTTWSLNTWYKIRTVFDALAGTYRVYLSNAGAAESQDISVSSSAKVCSFATLSVGSNTAGGDINGWIDAFRLIRAATVTTTETPGVTAPAITDYPVHYFSVPEMKMYSVTAASAGAGSNPTLTATTRLFVGECDTSGAAVTAVRNYALRGEYRGPVTASTPASSSATSASHNIGGSALYIRADVRVVCLTANNGAVVGDVGDPVSVYQSGTAEVSSPPVVVDGRNTLKFTISSNGLYVSSKTGGASFAVQSSALWAYQLSARRTF